MRQVRFRVLCIYTELNYDFNEGMTAISAELGPAVLDAYDFSGMGTLMDVAGGHGYFICQALQRHPHMKGILLDQAAVVEGAKCTLCEMRVDDVRPIRSPLFQPIRRIGGPNGWYFANFLSRLRGVLDLLVGGVGLRRVRRDPDVRLCFGFLARRSF